MKEDNDTKIKSKCRTIFPIGFGVSKTEDDIIIINHIDIHDSTEDTYEIVSSIAMSKNKAKSFIKALNDAIEGGSDDNE
jgi:hypothetical protein